MSKQAAAELLENLLGHDWNDQDDGGVHRLRLVDAALRDAVGQANAESTKLLIERDCLKDDLDGCNEVLTRLGVSEEDVAKDGIAASLEKVISGLKAPAEPEGDTVGELRDKLAQAVAKWTLYEQEYILPCFGWADEVGIDLEKLLKDNPGTNCVKCLVDELNRQVGALTRIE